MLVWRGSFEFLVVGFVDHTSSVYSAQGISHKDNDRLLKVYLRAIFATVLDPPACSHSEPSNAVKTNNKTLRQDV